MAIDAGAIRRLLTATAIALGALVLGLVASRPEAPAAIVGASAVVAFLAVLAKRRGVAIGLLVLAVQNGVPFLDTAAITFGGFALSDYLAIVLVLVLAVGSGADRAIVQRGTAIRTFGFALAGWWLLTVVRSTAAGVPLLPAIAFGKGYLIFALLVALFPGTLARERVRRDALLTVGAGALLYAVGQVIITVGGPQLSWLVHPIAVRSGDVGLVRVYGTVIQAVVLVAFLAFGAVLVGSARRGHRAIAWAALSISVAAIVLQQTRAIYLGFVGALALVTVLWLFAVRSARGMVGRRTVGGLVVFVVAIVAVAAVAPEILAAYGLRPLSRLSGVGSEVSSSTGNVGYRFGVAHTMTGLLGGSGVHWLAGLGFLDPRYRYFATLPEGSINNSDLGLLDGVVQIGIIGVALIFGSLLLAMGRMVGAVRSWSLAMPADAWVLFGITAWTVQALLASYSLGTLFQVQGQTLTAFVIAAGLNSSLPGGISGDS